MNAFESWKNACEQALINYPWIDARSVSPLGMISHGQIQSGVVFDVNRRTLEQSSDLAERIVQEVAPSTFTIHVAWLDSSHRAIETCIKLNLVDGLAGAVRYGCISSMDGYPDAAIKEAMEINGFQEYKIADYCNRSYTTFTFSSNKVQDEYPSTLVIDGTTFYRLTGV